MGYLRTPSYYECFRCTASACSDTCCIGWEIDIDDDTLQRYLQVGGRFGERLQRSIAVPSEGLDKSAHFILDEHERCPFLNEQNLCDVYLTLGEKQLCQICRDHPRYYDWFSDGMEAGIGLCCEAAAELILQPAAQPEFAVRDIDWQDETSFSPDLLLEKAMERHLFSMREHLLHISCDPADHFDAKIDHLYRSAQVMQQEFEALLTLPPRQPDTSEDWSARFWQPEQLYRLVDFFLSLEINDNSWRSMLVRLRADIPQIIAHRAAFLAYHAENSKEYDRLLCYFLFRHFMKARTDGALLSRVCLALTSTCMIQLAGIGTWLQAGTLSHSRQIALCVLYSKEIEYSEENTEKTAAYRP